MKKNVLALSITAALFGLTGGAQAMTGALGGATLGSSLSLNGDGVGQILLVPYFTAQDQNATLISLTNTDTVRGKAVKVRFRGAANSDDIYDFQVFLSPGDVWTANVSKGSDGRAQLTTADASCTKPAKSVLNVTPFVTARLDSTLTTDQKANGTREGYIEIFNMGDIPPLATLGATDDATAPANTTAGTVAAAGANPLYTAIKHVSSVAPCTGAAWTALDTNNLLWGTSVAAAGATPATLSARGAGLLPPTTGLMANWTIINVVGAAAWSGEAVAVQTTVATDAGNVVYWPQTGDPVGAANINAFTSDSLLRNPIAAGVGALYTSSSTGTPALIVAGGAPAVTAGYYDLPDLSTPYTLAAANPMAQAISITAAIAATSATNEFLTTSAISASTDWVFSMPTRRYSTAFNYGFTAAATNDGRVFTDLLGNAVATNGYFLPANTLVASSTNGNGRQICVKGIVPSARDREENSLTGGTTVVVSPSTPADPLSFCGEAAVLSINNGGILTAGTGALKASVAVKDLDVTYREGWMSLTTPGNGTALGLPVLGSSFARAFNGAQSFGLAHKHRFGR